MRTRIWIILALAAVMLSSTAADCILETKEIEVPVRSSEDMLFTTSGGSEHSGSEIVEFTDDLIEMEAENAFDKLVSAHIETGYWRVAENRGDADLVISGSVTVTRLGVTKGGLQDVSQTATLISYQAVPIASVLGPFKVAPLTEAGVNLLNAGFDEYLQARALGQPIPNLTYRFDWSGVATSSSSTPNVDFDWEGRVKFALVGLVEVDVPDPF